MIWKWKRPAAFLLAAAMIFTMPGVPASAVEAGVSAVHTGLCKHAKDEPCFVMQEAVIKCR